MAKLRSPKGQASLEIIITVALLDFMVAGTFSLFGSTIAESRSLVFRVQAEDILMEGLEATRQIQNQGWGYLVDGTHGLQLNGDTWQLAGTSDITDGRFERSIVVARVDDGQRDVTISVTWMNLQSREVTISTTTRFTTWPRLEIYGDWWTPSVAAAIDIGPGAESTSVIKREDIAYISAEINAEAKPSLIAFDVTSPLSPTTTGTLVVGDTLDDIAFDPDDNYIYAVGHEVGSELVVVDISDPINLVETTSLSLTSEGHAVLADEDTLYTGNETGLRVYDISTPSSPTYLTTYDLGDPVYDLAITGDYLALATHDIWSEFVILDVSNPSSPVSVEDGDIVTDVGANSVSIHADRLYVGMQESGTYDEIFVYDIQDPTTPVFLGSFNVPGTINDMANGGTYVFLATDLANEEFTMYEVSDPANPIQVTGLNMTQEARGIVFEENYIYIALRSNDAFQIIQSDF